MELRFTPALRTVLYLSLAAALPAWTAAPDRGDILAATCAGCHGSEGRSKANGLPVLAGRDPRELLGLLLDFRDGRRPATVMGQISKGYSPEQLAAVASHFSRQPLTADSGGRP